MSSIEAGVILDVNTFSYGSDLVSAAADGATSLVVESTADFNESGEDDEDYGGWLQIGDELLSYTRADEETNTLTLESATTEAYDVGERVNESPYSEYKIAEVQLDGFDQAIEVEVPQEFWERLPDGVREEGTRQWVDIEEYAPGSFRVYTLHGGNPDQMIDTGDGYFNITEQALAGSLGTDGLPPGESPTPTVIGGIGAFHLRWDGIDSPDAAAYDIYVTTADPGAAPITVDPADFVATVQSTSATVKRLPGDATDPATAFLYGTTYWFYIVAHDLHDPGFAPSGEAASGQLVPAETEDISANYAYLGTLVADQIVGGEMSADVSIAGAFRTASGDGRRVEMSNDEGVKVTEQDGSIAVHFPTDPLSPKQITGEMIAEALTVLAGFSVRGTSSVEKGSTVTLESTIVAPQAKPTTAKTWPILGVLTDDEVPDKKHGMFWDSATTSWFYCYTQTNDGGGLLRQADEDGSALSEVALLGPTGDDNYRPDGGVVKVGTDWYVLGQEHPSDNWYVYKYDSSFVYQSRWQYTQEPNGDRPALGTDGTNLFIARCNTAKVFYIRTFNTAGVQSSVINSNITAAGGGCDLSGVAYGLFDHGDATNRWVLMPRSSGIFNDEAFVFNTAGTLVPNYQFPIANEATTSGFAWDGSNFHHMSEDNSNIVQYTSNFWTTESDSWWVSFTWYDADATGGTHETSQSPRANPTMKKRALLTVTAPAIPDLGGTDDPDSLRVYIGRGASDPGRTNMWLQGTGTTSTVFVDDATLPGSTNPPSSSNFPAGTPSALQTAAGESYIKGDGAVRFGATGTQFKRIAFGQASNTVAGGDGTALISHTLGVTPDFMLISNTSASGAGARYVRLVAGTLSSTQFEVEGRDATGALTANGVNISCMWLAIKT